MKSDLDTDQEAEQREPLVPKDKPAPSPPANTARGSSLRRLLGYSFEHKELLLFGNIGLLVNSVASVYLPSVCGDLIDDIKNQNSMVEGLFALAAVSLGIALFGLVRGLCYNLLGERVMLALRCKLFGSLVGKDVHFYDSNKSGDLVSRLASDISVVQSAASDNISILVRSIFQFLGSLVFLWLISWQLTVVILVLGPPFIYCFMVIGKKYKALKKLYQEKLAEANAQAAEVFGNIRTVRSFANEGREKAEFGSKLQAVYETGRQSSLTFAVFIGLMMLLANTIIFAVLAYGGYLVKEGEVSIGQLTSYVLYAITLTVNLASISSAVNEMITASGVVQKIFSLIDEPVTIGSGPHSFGSELESIEFKDVTFAYPSKPDVKVFDSLNLTVRRGESVAVVGASGSGKSSLVGLLLRFYEVSEGRVMVNGRDIREVQLGSLRSMMGLVSQEPVLYSGSLISNIVYAADRQPTREQIKEVLVKSNAEEFVSNKKMFPEGLATVVGERGVKLSGGQKQRIAIARALVRDPRLLIFDEATSALDAQSEGQVQRSIAKIMSLRERTMIVIAHRLSTIKSCDRIVVLKDGRVTEDGSHQELLARRGDYFAMVEKQLSPAQ